MLFSRMIESIAALTASSDAESSAEVAAGERLVQTKHAHAPSSNKSIDGLRAKARAMEIRCL